MIWLTRLNHTPFVANAELITHMEVTPDTVIYLSNGQKIVVLESAQEVVGRVIQYRQATLRGLAAPAEDKSGQVGEING
jgi:flagellar protein FlbD